MIKLQTLETSVESSVNVPSCLSSSSTSLFLSSHLTGKPLFPACSFLPEPQCSANTNPTSIQACFPLPFLYCILLQAELPPVCHTFPCPFPKHSSALKRDYEKRRNKKNKQANSLCPWGCKAEMQIHVGVGGDHGMAQDFLDPPHKGCCAHMNFQPLLQARSRKRALFW